PVEVGAMAAMMLGVGYTVSSLAPVALGGVRDATGSFTAVLWLIVGATGMSVATALQGPRYHVAGHGAERRPSRADLRSVETVLGARVTRAKPDGHDPRP